ncbi:MAG: DinB family protein [Mycobacteriales bacterium]
MTWIAPTPPPLADGPLVGEDRPILEAFLADQRHVLLTKCAGLTAEQLATRAAGPSTLSLLGLVRHMAKVERIWFRLRVAGEAIEPLYEAALGKDHDFENLDPACAEGDFATYLEECRLADEAVADIPFEHAFELRGETYSLQLVYVHMVTEYARHNGHADLIREMIDGMTG